MITAITAVGALVFTGLSLNATGQQLDVARQQNAVAEQGQITDRYGKAVEQVGRQGPENLQIRLGGIYALERLAHDSPRDQSTIIAVLSAFVRTSTPEDSLARECPGAEYLDGQYPQDRDVERPREDVQTALTVLGRRDFDQDHDSHIDLAGACLMRADLQGLDLRHGYFIRANLALADLRSARLNGAQLVSVTLLSADISNADFSDSDLGAANLVVAGATGAKFRGAKLVQAHFERAILTNVDFTHANLTLAKFRYCTFKGADFSGADLNGADLRGADLRPDSASSRLS